MARFDVTLISAETNPHLLRIAYMENRYMPEKQNSAALIVTQLKVIGVIVVALWSLEIVDFLGSGWLDNYGIRPRSAAGLNGILFAPWLHFGFGHVAANTVPFAVMGWFTMLKGFGRFATVTVIITLLGGAGTWLIGGAGTIHAGASILIFGYFGYLLFNGIFERSLHAMSIALITILLYGYMIWGVLPITVMRGISWEGHLSGFLAGALAAWLFSERKPKRDIESEIEIGI